MKAVYLFVLSLFVLQSQADDIRVGAERMGLYLPLIQQQRIGLLVNHTSVVQRGHIVDVLLEKGVDVGVIFSPEHGFRGDADAGAHVGDGVDAKTGVAVYSLYGKRKQPDAEVMATLDWVIFDIQDVGVRFYTYISSMHYLMQACADTGTPMMVLDRPNPNGDYVDGPILQFEFSSFVGMHPIPLVHGLTVGELAVMINNQGWLEGGKRCDLTVIPVENYHHQLPYRLPIKPSPNLPNYASVRLYPSLGLFEASPVSVGRGTEFPFQVLGYQQQGFGEFCFTPRSIEGASLHPRYENIQLCGDDFRDQENHQFTLEILLDWQRRLAELSPPVAMFDRPEWIDKLMGTDQFRLQLEQGWSEQQIRASWQRELEQYNVLRRQYLLYPE